VKIEHKHIAPNDPKWDRYKYICECGFETPDRLAFDRHLEAIEKDADREMIGDDVGFGLWSIGNK